MTILEIGTTSYCNGKCIFCPYPDSWGAKNPGIMSEEMFLDIVKKYPKIELFNMFLFNEPFLDPRLFDLMEKAQKVSKIDRFLISTNANFIPNDIERLKDFPHTLQVSFHGKDEESYERIMGLDYYKAVTNVKLLDKLGFKFTLRGFGQARIKTGSEYDSLFTENEYINHWRSLGLGHQTFDCMTFHDRAGQSTKVSFGYNGGVSDCPRYGDWHSYDHTGFETLCCMDFNHTGRYNRELCKHCISPGG